MSDKVPHLINRSYKECSFTPGVVQTFWLFSLVWTKITDLKGSSDHGPEQLIKPKQVFSFQIKQNHGWDGLQCEKPLLDSLDQLQEVETALNNRRRKTSVS